MKELIKKQLKGLNRKGLNQKGLNRNIQEGMNENNRKYRLLISSLSEWLAGIEEDGRHGDLFYGSLVTMMFHHISASHRSRCDKMFSEAERVYNTLLRHLVHHPNRPSSWAKWPIMIMVPDYPVEKRRDYSFSTISDVSLNDGLHLHGGDGAVERGLLARARREDRGRRPAGPGAGGKAHEAATCGP